MPCHSSGATGVRSVRGLCPTPAVGSLQLKEEGEKQPELAAAGGGSAASAEPSSSSVGLIVSDRQHGLYWLQVRGWRLPITPPPILEVSAGNSPVQRRLRSRNIEQERHGWMSSQVTGSGGRADPAGTLSPASSCGLSGGVPMLRACVRACVRALPPRHMHATMCAHELA
jgi:hypothetical protein